MANKKPKPQHDLRVTEVAFARRKPKGGGELLAPEKGQRPAGRAVNLKQRATSRLV